MDGSNKGKIVSSPAEHQPLQCPRRQLVPPERFFSFIAAVTAAAATALLYVVSFPLLLRILFFQTDGPTGRN